MRNSRRPSDRTLRNGEYMQISLNFILESIFFGVGLAMEHARFRTFDQADYDALIGKLQDSGVGMIVEEITNVREMTTKRVRVRLVE